MKSTQKIIMLHSIVITATTFHHLAPDILLNASDPFSPLTLPTACEVATAVIIPIYRWRYFAAQNGKVTSPGSHSL